MGTSPDGQYQNQIEYILCSQRWRSSIESAKTRPGADCGLDHELIIAKFKIIHFDIWQNSISLCPASFRTPRPNSPVTPGVS